MMSQVVSSSWAHFWG